MCTNELRPSVHHVQQLRDIKDLIGQVLDRLVGLEQQTPLPPQLIRVKWELRDLPSDLDVYVERLERAAKESASPRDDNDSVRIDLPQLERDLMDLAASIDHLRVVTGEGWDENR